MTSQSVEPVLRLRFGIDLDGVCFNWDEAAARVCYKLWQMAIPEGDHWDWLEELLGPEKWDLLWEKGPKMGLFDGEGLLYPGTKTALKELSKLGDVVFVTSRKPDDDSIRNATLDWLSRENLPFRELVFLSGDEKHQAACDLFLDDRGKNLSNIEERYGFYVPLLLWSRPWNQKEQIEGVQRVSSWEEVLSVAKEVAEKFEQA